MKMATRVIVLLLALLCLAGCGKPAAEAPDFQAVYDSMTALTDMPDMVVVPNDKGEFLFGIAPGDCKQEIVAICQDSLLADELWLIEATDQEAADRIEALAQNRVQQKAAELENYLLGQYQVVQQAQLSREGNCVVLLVSPLAKELAKLLK